MVGVALNGKRVALSQLQAEIVAAGVQVTTGLGSDTQFVWTYDAQGQPSDFPQNQAPTVQTVITAHVPDTTANDDLTAAMTYLAANYATAKTRLTQIQNANSPTNAQVVAAVQDLATIQLGLLRLIKNRLT